MTTIKVYFDQNNFISIPLDRKYCILKQLSAYSQLQDYDIFLHINGRIKMLDNADNLKIEHGDIIDAFKSLPNQQIRFKVPAILTN